MKRQDNTFHTALVPRLDELGFPPIPKESDKAEQLLQELWTIGYCWHSSGPWWGGYNPEKYLNRWAAILSSRDDLLFDVIGWAFFATKRELEYKKQKKLTPYDFLAAQKPRVLLGCLKQWAEARLRYHRAGLQLTFYKCDTLAGREPIASNVEWLRQRLKHFVAVRTKEIQPEPELDDLDAEITPAQRKTIQHRCSLSELDYLCWLHLVSPISEQWTLVEISRAVKKTFFDQTYYDWKEKWLAKPPMALTYSVPAKNDSPGQRFKKMTVPVGFEDAEAEWLSGVLLNLRPFSDSLDDKLTDTKFRCKKHTGRPPKMDSETPSPTKKGYSHDLATIVRSHIPLENFEILGKKDLEKDDPKGWLLAKTITV